MAPVILSMNVHCDSCAKKIRKAVMKVPGVTSVTASFETGLVVVEGTADVAALRARIQAKAGNADVNVVSDGAEDGWNTAGAEDDGWTTAGVGSGGTRSRSSDASLPPRAAADPAPAILEMDLHCRSCANKVEKHVKKIPGVVTVTTDVQAGRVEVTGTADASVVATRLEAKTRRSVRVVQPGGGISPPPSPPPVQQSYGAPPSQASYYYPAPGETNWYSGGQYWPAPPSQPPPGFYTDQGGEMFGGQQWSAYPPPQEGYYSGQGGEYYSGQGGAYDYGGQEGDAPSTCVVQ